MDLESEDEGCISAEGAGARAVEEKDEGLPWSSKDSLVIPTDASWNDTAGEAAEVPPNTPCSGECISLLNGSLTSNPFPGLASLMYSG